MRKALAMAFIAVVLFAVWSVALKNGFVYDDHKYIVGNPWIKDIVFTKDIFSSSTSGFSPMDAPSNTYRPMLYMLYMTEYLAFGLKPLYFHLVNIVAHIVNALLVFLMALFLLERQGREALLPALFAGLAFGLHTINSEVVNWASASTELFFTLFVLAGINLYLRRQSGLLSAPFFLVALLFKETAVALPVIVFFHDLSRGAPIRERWKSYAFFIAAGAVYGLMRLSAIGGVMHHKQIAFSFLDTVVNIFPLVSVYFGKLVFPASLSALYEFHPARSVFDVRVLGGVLITLSFFAAVFFTRKKPAIIAGLAMIMVPLLPVLYVPALSSSAIADRYLYLPSAGLAIILAALLSMANGKAFKVSLAVASAVLAAWAAGSVSRSQVWMSDHTLWRDAVEKAPNAPNAHYNYAWASQNAGDTASAITHYRRAAELAPSADAHFNLGVILMNSAMIEEAEAEFLAALAIDPSFDGARMKLVEIQRLRGAGA